MTPAAGRPLRFLMLVLGGWTAMRAAVLLPEAAELTGLVVADAAPSPAVVMPAAAIRLRAVAARPPERPRVPARPIEGPAPVPLAFEQGPRIEPAVPQSDPPALSLVAPYLPAPRPTAPANPFRALAASRLSGSGWLALRPGGGESLGPGGQLGGSQGGVRLRYALGAGRRFALSARLSAPVEGLGREAALGLEWRPRGAPVALIAEHRLGLDGTPSGPALLAVGGLAPRPIAAGFSLEGYAQAGGVLRAGRSEPFADGALRLAAPVANAGRAGEVTLGLGAWGGAQRDAQRLDLGPSAAIALPVGGRSLRLTLDYRQRIAGGARPNSGLALTLGSDF
ncbi:hypothetical protein [Sphingomonas sp. Y38-1Y]|uniref:hypothetical protein n=1 Tax=Sphingomonas sp. Y38-1Y TaxID=3078265 RepID=UPI0028E35F51|nr:hypothetical protein [Sphingomonas sp. Y38-1Y]